MKIRLGFVTNSSTSSFVLTTDLEPGEIEEKLYNLVDFYNEFFDEDAPYGGLFVDVKRLDDFQREKLKKKCEEFEPTSSRDDITEAIDRSNTIIYNDRCECIDQWHVIVYVIEHAWSAVGIPFGKDWIYEEEINE